jgi:hypothetical protein
MSSFSYLIVSAPNDLPRVDFQDIAGARCPVPCVDDIMRLTSCCSQRSTATRRCRAFVADTCGAELWRWASDESASSSTERTLRAGNACLGAAKLRR